MTLYDTTVLPIKAGLFISIDQAGNNNSINLTAYQQLVGKLIYLACNIWLNISFIVSLLSRYNFNLKIEHFHFPK